MLDPRTDLEQAIYNRLVGGTADATTLPQLLGGTFIWNGLSPRGDLPAFVTFQHTAGDFDNTTPRQALDYLYLIKGISIHLADAYQLSSVIFGLVHDFQFTVSGWNNFWTAQETIVDYDENDPVGHHIVHAGAQYRIRLAKT